jgi:hypothetical protein
MKILCYELNEVPWVVIDDYITKKPKSVLAAIINNSSQFTTVTRDTDELTPFCTWPTMHRGVYNHTHQIYFVNQEIATSYMPIWEILAQNNYKVGVFGSLHSWPIPQGQIYSFYVPHTFAQDSQTIPESLQAFQAFNLEQTKRDGGVVARAVNIKKNYVKTLYHLLKNGLKLSTAFKLGWHVFLEKCNPNYKTFRSIMQAPVAFDFYWRSVKNYQPDFSTFFSNHVAGMMHRYWKYSFPQDFCYQLVSKRERFLAKNIERAMDITNQQLKKFKSLCDQEGYQLVIVSSMGQEALDRGQYRGELRITQPEVFIKKLGFADRVKSALSMQPYFAFLCESSEILEAFKQVTQQFTSAQGGCLFNYIIANNTINLKLKGYNLQTVDTDDIYFQGQPIAKHEYGIELIHRDVGTGYHRPEGVAIFYGKDVKANRSRKEVESIQILPTLLDCYQLEKQPYMAPSFYHEVFVN